MSSEDLVWKDKKREIEKIEKRLMREAAAINRTAQRWRQGRLGPFVIRDEEKKSEG